MIHGHTPLCRFTWNKLFHPAAVIAVPTIEWTAGCSMLKAESHGKEKCSRTALRVKKSSKAGILPADKWQENTCWGKSYSNIENTETLSKTYKPALLVLVRCYWLIFGLLCGLTTMNFVELPHGSKWNVQFSHREKKKIRIQIRFLEAWCAYGEPERKSSPLCHAGSCCVLTALIAISEHIIIIHHLPWLFTSKPDTRGVGRALEFEAEGCWPSCPFWRVGSENVLFFDPMQALFSASFLTSSLSCASTLLQSHAGWLCWLPVMLPG